MFYILLENFTTSDNVNFLSSTKQQPVIFKSIPDLEVMSQENTVQTKDNVSKMEKSNLQKEIDCAIPLVHCTFVANDEKQLLVDS